MFNNPMNIFSILGLTAGSSYTLPLLRDDGPSHHRGPGRRTLFTDHKAARKGVVYQKNGEQECARRRRQKAVHNV